MAYTNIDDPSAHHQTKLYTGTGASHNITNDGNSDLQPDWVWIKRYSSGGNYSHAHFDSTRGSTKRFYWPGTAVQDNNAQYITSFNTDGFTAGTDANINENNLEYVAWQWKAGGGSVANNTDGNITSSVQANPDAGFSIVTYTGNGVQTGKTVGHGLNSAPKMIISKDTGNNSNVITWRVYHVGVGPTKYMEFASAAAVATYNDWDNTAPTASVYSVGGAGGYTPTNTNNANYQAFVFADVQGYSKFGKYVGNGNSNGNGPFVYTGFKPAWIMVKNASRAGYSWSIIDNQRDAFNEVDNGLQGNSAAPESSTSADYGCDFLSNGFKVRAVNTGYLGGVSGDTMIYMAFAENPFVTSTRVPTTAR